MRSVLSSLTVMLTLAATASAESPKASIKGPSGVAPEGTIVLDARGSVADRPLRWKLDGPDVPFLTLDQEGRKGVVAIVPAAPAGTYKFTLIARGVPPGEVELDADAAIWVVTVEPVAPPVPPAPGPNPPNPVSGPLHVSLVVDLDSMTPDLATLRAGIKARETFQTLDVVYRTYSSSSTDLARLNLVNSIAKAGTPCLIVQNAAGKVIGVEKAPVDEDGLIAMVKSYRGAR